MRQRTKKYTSLRTANRYSTMDKTEWDKARKFFISLNDEQIELIARRLVEFMPNLENELHIPTHYLTSSMLGSETNS